MKLYKTTLHTIINGIDVSIEIGYNKMIEEDYKKLGLKFKINYKTVGSERKEVGMIIEKNAFEGKPSNYNASYVRK